MRFEYESNPITGNVPQLGNLFKRSRKQQQMSDLYFFVTSRMVIRWDLIASYFFIPFQRENFVTAFLNS
jgi:hypothetical protein